MHTQPGKEEMGHKWRRWNKIWLGDKLHPTNTPKMASRKFCLVLVACNSKSNFLVSTASDSLDLFVVWNHCGKWVKNRLWNWNDTKALFKLSPRLHVIAGQALLFMNHFC